MLKASWCSSRSNVAKELRGRIFGAYGATAGLAVLTGQALASMFGDRIGIIPVLDMMGLAYLLAGLLALLLLRRTAAATRAPAGEQISPVVETV